MTTVLDWQPSADPVALVAAVRDALAAGRAVVAPGDAGYVVLVNPSAAGADASLAAAATDRHPAALAWGPDDAAGLGLAVPAVARRLMTRVWAGPLVVALPADGAACPGEWAEAARLRAFAGGLARFRCPDHPVFDSLTPAMPFPVLVADTLSPTAAPVAGRLGGQAGLVVDAGEQAAVPPPTVVRADAAGWRVLEEGAFSAADLQRFAARIVLFVCTGNTCRSPMAEGLAKAMLAERMGCTPDDLPARGVWVLSAGVAAFAGGDATPEAQDVAREHGADLSAHRSRPVNPQLLAAADHVVAMTRSHAAALAGRYPGLGPRVELLCGADADLDDPIGGGIEVYRGCARAIRTHLERFLPEWSGT